jgi:hypothetical protein
MNTANHRRAWLYAAVAASLAVLTLLAFVELRSARAAATAALKNLADCEQLAAEVVKLGGRPSHVTMQAHSATEVARRIEAATQVAQIPSNCLVRIDPQPPRRLGDTAYKEQATHVDLREVSLQQLLRFLHELERGETPLRAKSLRLAAPAQVATGAVSSETWGAELTLTYVDFAPKNPPAAEGKKR